MEGACFAVRIHCSLHKVRKKKNPKRNNTSYIFTRPEARTPVSLPAPIQREGEPCGRPQRERREPAPAPPCPPAPRARPTESALHRYRVRGAGRGPSRWGGGMEGLPQPLREAVRRGAFGRGFSEPGLTGRSLRTGLWRRTYSRGRRARRQGPGRAPCGRCSTRPGQAAALSAAPRL